MAMRTTHSTESTQAKLYMYLTVPIKYYTLIWSSWAVELNNETASVSLDSLLYLQWLTTNERNIDTYFLWDLNANIIFQICALKQMWLHIMLAVWLILMAIISAFETNWTDFFLFSSFFCPSKTDICFNSQTLLTQTLRGPQKVSVISRLNLEKREGLGKPPTQAFLVELLCGRDKIRAPLKTLAWETRVRDKENCL